MDCKTVMGPVAVPLYADDPASTAIDFMREKRTGLVPVVDREGTFVGLLSGDRMMHFMIPRAITMMRGKKHASYLQESPAELQARLDSLRGQTIGDLVDPDVKVAHEDTPFIDAMLLISEKQFVVPVVDADNKLVGAISFFTLLHFLRVEQEKTVGDAS
ncbi:MAG: CBS domain-containing protein [Rhodospirillaceae bacterium]|jgi:CBS-domain-containing membrane protein|nr:CBS domain-containing protein [Rhodospirillaceae bacterium]MBT6407109.1 CBS domain-containing protein [Rhodospirillaceae bacterium]